MTSGSLTVIFNFICENPNVSRAEISEKTGLSRSSVNEKVRKLISDGLITESAPIKRKTLLNVNNDNIFSIKVIVSYAFTKTELYKYDGSIIKQERLPSYRECTESEFYNMVLKSCLRAVKFSKNRVREINISVPESFNGESVKNIFENNLHISTLVDKLTKNSAEVENDGQIEGLSQYIRYDDEVSFIQLYKGKPVSESKMFSHMKVGRTGLCSCGRIGCLNSYLQIEQVSVETPKMLVKALRTVSEVTGNYSFTIGGKNAGILSRFEESFRTLCPEINIKIE